LLPAKRQIRRIKVCERQQSVTNGLTTPKRWERGRKYESESKLFIHPFICIKRYY